MNFDEADKTDWLPGTVAPAYEGVYERRFNDGMEDMSRFEGDLWYRGSSTVEEAWSHPYRSDYQADRDNAFDFEWRGLARDPNVVLREDLLALREIALDAAAEALGEAIDEDPMPHGHRDITDNDPGPSPVVASDAPGLALDSGEFIPAAELNAQAAVDDEEDLF